MHLKERAYSDPYMFLYKQDLRPEARPLTRTLPFLAPFCSSILTPAFAFWAMELQDCYPDN